MACPIETNQLGAVEEVVVGEEGEVRDMVIIDTVHTHQVGVGGRCMATVCPDLV